MKTEGFVAMKKKLSVIRRWQKQVMETAETIADKTSVVLDEAAGGLKKLDNQFGITIKLKETGGKIGELAQQADQDFAISDKARALKKAASTAAAQAGETAMRAAEETGWNKGWLTL